VLGYRQVIPGWEEAIALMNKGSKMTVYIPSGLAYGPQKRSEVIAENSILMFQMELVDIK
jgi:FKBP-type peptidyl-prolyl cis-trans isomerase FkpA